MPSPFSKSSNNPFSVTTPVGITLPSNTEAVEVNEEVVTQPVEVEKKVRKPRTPSGNPRQKARRVTAGEQDYIVNNYREKGPHTIALELNVQNKTDESLKDLTASQVSAVVRSARKKAEGLILQAKESGDMDRVQRLQVKMEFMFPIGTFSNKKEKRTNSLETIVENLFSDI